MFQNKKYQYMKGRKLLSKPRNLISCFQDLRLEPGLSSVKLKGTLACESFFTCLFFYLLASVIKHLGFYFFNFLAAFSVKGDSEVFKNC